MTESTKRSLESANNDRALEGAEANGGHGEASKARRPYSQPKVQKRRSVNYATLVSGGGTSGALTTG
jgi:hypothetical protein